MLAMDKSKINDHLTTLESFKYYLEHIIKSIRDDNYNLKYVEDLAKTINSYYEKINSDKDSNSDREEPDLESYQNLDGYNNFEFVDPNFIDGSSDDELYGFYNNSDNSNEPKEDETEDEDEDDDNEKKLESKVESSNKECKSEDEHTKININKKSKERLDNFINGIFPIDKIHLYKKDNEYTEVINKFKTNSKVY